MKKLVSLMIGIVTFSVGASIALAQTSAYPSGMMGYSYESTTSKATTTPDATEAMGASIWDKLTNNEISCDQLNESDFEALGEYFMGSMMGSYHEQMDQYVTRSLGEQGDTAMHIAMGERLSGCAANATFPAHAGFFPMMMGGYGVPYGYGYDMLYGGYDDWWNSILNAALLIFALIGLIAVVRWIISQRTNQ